MEKKIQEVIKLLNDGISLTTLDKDGFLGCTMKTFRKRAAELGYVYNKTLKNYVKVDDIQVVEPVAKPLPVEDVTEDVTTDVTEDSVLTLESLNARIKALEDIVLHNANTVTHDNTLIALDERTKGVVITRSIKATKEAIEAFNSVAESKLAMFSKQELFSQALLEFAEKYK